MPEDSPARREEARACPDCGQMMVKERERGITIDVCEEHGIWLDRGELEVIKRTVRSSQRHLHRQAVREARRKGKVSGAFWGWLSLLWDD